MKPSTQTFQLIQSAIQQDKKNYNWPDHLAAHAGRVCEASGELMRFSLHTKYSRKANEKVSKVQIERMRTAAAKVAARAMRFLENTNDATHVNK